MMRHLLRAVLALGLLVASPVLAQSSPRAEAIGKAAEAVQICAEQMPDRRGVIDALRAVGFQPREATGALRAYSAANFRTVVILPGAADSVEGCSITVRAMTLAEGEVLIQPWLKIAHAVEKHGDTGRYDRVWTGVFKNVPVLLLIEEDANLNVLRGTTIMALARR
ncbi:hypothetical protein [Paracoccus sp. (in: a-proteobacteria)]|uniref:hypothetical protein n=1 Tax=Paracoccus sp. TaxID=267 RepID=UPI002AFE002C|nr:hypothetical protein [Paracoccus sp. (in: a-proteobacteria)]